MTEAHAFISYVREDAEMVGRIERVLQAAEIRVWRDTNELWPGEDWRLKIRQAITDDALVFVACFSNHSLQRAKTYQNEELNLAVEQLRLRRPDQPWLIPVRLTDCPLPSFDLGGGRTLSSLHWVDLFGDRWDTGIARLVTGVQRTLSAPDQRHSDGALAQHRRTLHRTASDDVILRGHTYPVRAMSVVAVRDQTLLASVDESTIRLWDPASGQAVRPPVRHPKQPLYVYDVCAVPVGDRTLLALASTDIKFWNPTGHEVRPPLKGNAGRVKALCTVPLGKRTLLASAGWEEPVVRLWEPVTGQEAGSPLKGHDGLVNAVCAVPVGDRTLLASAGTDRTVRLWDPTGHVRPPLKGHDGEVNAVCAVPVGDRTLLASAGYDETVRLWDPVTGQAVRQILTTGHGNVGAVHAVPVGDRTFLASAGRDIQLWDPASGQPLGESFHARAPICAVPVGGRTLLASASIDRTIRLSDPADFIQ